MAIGPLPASDSKFMRRVRVHQAWYRYSVLDLAGFGRLAGSGRPCGSVLPDEGVRRHLNFVTHDALDRYLERRRRGWGVDPIRCTSYLTSSQALSFNMLAHVVARPVTCVALFNSLLGRSDLARLETSDFEFAAQGSGYALGDKTLIDVLLRFRTRQGHLQVVAVETKLADRFSTRRTGAEVGENYRQVSHASRLWANFANSVANNRTRQLTRCHALAQAVQLADEPDRIGQAVLIVLTHPADAGADRCVGEYASGVAEDTLIHKFWSDFLDLVRVTDSREAGVADELARRYVDLSWSESAWAQFEMEGDLGTERSA